MANPSRQRYDNRQRDDYDELAKVLEENSNLRYHINQAKRNKIDLIKDVEHWKSLYARAQAKTDLDSVNVKLAEALEKYNKEKANCEQLKSSKSEVEDVLVEKSARIRELEKELENEKEKNEIELSKTKYAHGIQVENYELELKELRKLVRDSDNIEKKDTKLPAQLQAQAEEIKKLKDEIGGGRNTQEKQHNLLEKQNDYIKCLEDILEMSSGAIDENYLLHIELREGGKIIKELDSVAKKTHSERLKEYNIYEEEKGKMERDLQKQKKIVVEKGEQLENNMKEMEKVLGFLETMKNMMEFSGDDNFPLINQLDVLEACLKEKMKIVSKYCKMQVQKVSVKPQTPTTTFTTTLTGNTTLKNVKEKPVKQPISKKKRHEEDLSRKIPGRGKDDHGAKYFCSCNFTTKSKEILQNHIQHYSRGFKCDECPKRFVHEGRLKNHLKRVHGHGLQLAAAGGGGDGRKEKASHSRTSQHDNSDPDIIIIENPNEQRIVSGEEAISASNSNDELGLPAAPRAPPSSPGMNCYSDENGKSSRNTTGGETVRAVDKGQRKRDDPLNELESSRVRNSSSSPPPPPPPKRRRVIPSSDEDDDVDVEAYDVEVTDMMKLDRL